MKNCLIRHCACVGMTIILFTCMTGCFDRRELDTFGIVMGVAIDKADDPTEKYDLTMQIVSPKKGGSKGKEAEKDSGSSGDETSDYININQTGRAINYMIREMQSKMSRMVYVAHSENIVIGEEVAKDDVEGCLDFFARAQEARMSQYLFIAEGKASDIYSVPAEFEDMPSMMLTKILADQQVISQAPRVTQFDFLCCMIRKTKSAVMPIVRIVVDDDKQRLEVSGCGVFKDQKLIGKLDATQTRGMLFIENKVKTGVLELQIDDALATAEIRKADSTVTSHLYDDGSIQYDIDVKATVGMGDQTGTVNLSAIENIPKFREAATQAIKNEIQSAVDQAKKLHADVFGFGERIMRKYPDAWAEMEDNWDALFPNVNVNITVDVRSDGNGRISSPLTPETAP